MDSVRSWLEHCTAPCVNRGRGGRGRGMGRGRGRGDDRAPPPYRDPYADPYADPYYRRRYLPPPPAYDRYSPYPDPYERRRMALARDPYYLERERDYYDQLAARWVQGSRLLKVVACFLLPNRWKTLDLK